MQLHLMSDLHREWGRPKDSLPFVPKGDVVILAGDIVTSKTKHLLVEEFGKCEVPVLYVPGNHDYYGGKWEDELGKMRSFYKDPIRLLENDTFRLDDVTFIGTTLWPDISPLEEGYISHSISDFITGRGGISIIDGFTVNKCREANHKAREYLAANLSWTKLNYPDDKVVVITHFPPSYREQEDRFKGGSLSSYFYNKCDYLIEKFQPDIWIYGHTHGNVTWNDGKTKVVTNQFGYLNREHTEGFNKDYTVELQDEN